MHASNFLPLTLAALTLPLAASAQRTDSSAAAPAAPAATRLAASAPVATTARVTSVTTLDAEAVNATPMLPVFGGEGAAVLHVQALLDAAGFSPGALDGRWQENTRKAVRAFRETRGLAASDSVDEATYARLRAELGERLAVTEYTLTEEDVRGPFVRMPESVYAKARLSCLCYTSPLELLAERVHATPELLRALNPGVSLERGARAGTVVVVPNVQLPAPTTPVARLVVLKRETIMRALDSAGTVLFQLPVSVGSMADPSPTGTLRVTSVTRNPHYHYNPRLFADVPDSRPGAHLPPGPNSPVGILWMQLSKAHVGIHGTPEPHTVGYAASHGCVRVTNWHATRLAELVAEGVPVEFR
jgi:lipoprotein-anchoring transpeptidase ErfK/SrfK